MSHKHCDCVEGLQAELEHKECLLLSLEGRLMVLRGQLAPDSDSPPRTLLQELKVQAKGWQEAYDSEHRLRKQLQALLRQARAELTAEAVSKELP